MFGDGAPQPLDPRHVGLLLGGVLAALALWFWLNDGQLWWWLLAPASALLGLAWLAPAALRPLARAWQALGEVLHRVTNPLVMGLLFYLMLTPVALLRRSLRPDPLGLRRDPARASYLVRRAASPDVASLRRQF